MQPLNSLNIAALKQSLCPAFGLPSDHLRNLFEKGEFRSFPTLNNMRRTPQNPLWHPEGNVLNHTLSMCDKAWEQRDRIPEQQHFPALLATLLHDNGKCVVTRFHQGRWRASGHESAGEAAAKQFLKALGVAKEDFDFIIAFVTQHMLPVKLFRQHQKGEIDLPEYTSKVSSLINKIKPEWLETFLILCHADAHARQAASKDIPIDQAIAFFRAFATSCPASNIRRIYQNPRFHLYS